MTTRRITKSQAAHLSIAAQFPFSHRQRNATIEDIRLIVNRLGCIQIDTISVVARSHYLVLWSRLGDYDPGLMDQFHFPERGVFEYWAHAASFIDTSLLPAFLPRMKRNHERYHPTSHDWASSNHDVLERVRQYVARNGPVTTLAFDRPNPDKPVEPWEWWGGKPTNRALDLLWTTGELAIRRRIAFRREYDLFERVHPEVTGLDSLSVEEERLSLARRALSALGISRPEWLNDYFRTKWGNRNDQPPGPDELLRQLTARDEAIPVEIEGLGAAYVASEYAETLDAVQRGWKTSRTTLLSPFDNLIWDRKRTSELFDFDYRIECYTPAPKRIYGYFTLPILRRGRLIGRIDPKIDRKSGVFRIKSLHLEPGVWVSPKLIEDVSTAVRSFARWNGGHEIVMDHGPDAFRDAATSPLI